MNKGFLLLFVPIIFIINQVSNNVVDEDSFVTYNNISETEVINLEETNLTEQNNRKEIKLEYQNKQNRRVTLTDSDVNIKCYTQRNNKLILGEDVSVKVLFSNFGSNKYYSSIELDNNEKGLIKIIINYKGKNLNENILCDYQIAINTF